MAQIAPIPFGHSAQPVHASRSGAPAAPPRKPRRPSVQADPDDVVQEEFEEPSEETPGPAEPEFEEPSETPGDADEFPEPAE